MNQQEAKAIQKTRRWLLNHVSACASLGQYQQAEKAKKLAVELDLLASKFPQYA